MTHSSCFTPQLPKAHAKIFWQGLPGASQPLAVWHAAYQADSPVIVLTNDTLSANQLYDELQLSYENHLQYLPMCYYGRWAQTRKSSG